MQRTLWTAAGFAALALTPAFAGPINKKLVGTDARWVFHLDVESAAASTIGRLALRDDDAAGGLAELKAEFGVDLLKDVKGLTAWGAAGDGEDAVVIVHASNVVDQLLEQHADEANIERVEAEGYELLRWTDGAEAHFGHVRKTRRGDDRLVFLGRHKDDVLRALRVADGEAPGGGPVGPMAEGPVEGAFMFFSTPDLANLVNSHRDIGFNLPHMDKVRGLVLEAGEAEGDVFATVRVVAATEEDARSMMQAAQGLLALGRLIASGEKESAEITKLIDMVSIGGSELTVSARVRCSAENLEAMLAAHRKPADADHEQDKDDDAGRPDDPAPARRGRRGTDGGR